MQTGQINRSEEVIANYRCAYWLCDASPTPESIGVDERHIGLCPECGTVIAWTGHAWLFLRGAS